MSVCLCVYFVLCACVYRHGVYLHTYRNAYESHSCRQKKHVHAYIGVCVCGCVCLLRREHDTKSLRSECPIQGREIWHRGVVFCYWANFYMD